jgi:hypothetical protein
MRTYLRGFLPSLGAGGSLVAAALVVAAIVSGLFAFQGWPGADAAGADGGAVVLGDARGGVDARTVSAPAASPASRPVRVASAPGVVRRSRGGSASGRRTGAVVPRAASPAPTPSAPATRPPGGRAATAPPPAAHTPEAGPPATPSTPGPLPVPVPAVPARPAGTIVDDVQQVVPPLAAPVQPAVGAVNHVLDETAATVDDTVQGVTGTLGGLLGR